MTGKQLQQLSKMKKLIINSKRKFANRKDRDYLQELLEIGIVEEVAWQEILTLNKSHYIMEYRPVYMKTGDVLTFKKNINGYLVYIKLKIEVDENGEIVVCLSFHIDER